MPAVSRSEDPADQPPSRSCPRNHDWTKTFYRDAHGRNRCTECNTLARYGPLTQARRKPRSYAPEFQQLLQLSPRRLEKAMLRLEPREREFVRLRLGLDRMPRVPRTHREVGDMLGVSRQWVQMVESDAVRILREALRLRALDERKDDLPPETATG